MQKRFLKSILFLLAQNEPLSMQQTSLLRENDNNGSLAQNIPVLNFPVVCPSNAANEKSLLKAKTFS